MPKYIATCDTWLSHECRLVKAGAEFETAFPAGMNLSDNIKLVEPVAESQGKKAKQPGGKADDLV